MHRFATILFTLVLGMILVVRTHTADADYTASGSVPGQQPAKLAAAAPDIRVSLATLERTQRNLIVGQPGITFYVAMENQAKATRTLLAENCSWGYEMLAFEAMDANGNLYTVKRVEHPWYKNVPNPVPLEPGETVLRPVALGDGTWRGLPAMTPGKSMSLKLRAILHIEPEFPLTDRGFWFGRSVSNWVTFTYARS